MDTTNRKRTIFASLAAALIGATILTFFPGANVPVEAGTPMAAAKGDRLDFRPIGKACSERAWPYFEADCLRGKTMNARPEQVRLVTADRLRG